MTLEDLGKVRTDLQEISRGKYTCSSCDHFKHNFCHRHITFAISRIISLYLSITFLHTHIMFRRQLLRSSRAASQHLSQTPRLQQITLSSSSSFSSIARQPSRSAIPQYISRRWQSTETAKDAKATDGEAKPAEPSAEDALKQEVEKKNKEIIDLKVSQL